MSFSSSTKQVLFVACLLYSMALMHCQQTKVRNHEYVVLVVFLSHTRLAKWSPCFELMLMAILIKPLRSMIRPPDKHHNNKHHIIFCNGMFLSASGQFVAAILPFVPVSYRRIVGLKAIRSPEYSLLKTLRPIDSRSLPAHCLRIHVKWSQWGKWQSPR
jgi:hypothetical protein